MKRLIGICLFLLLLTGCARYPQISGTITTPSVPAKTVPNLTVTTDGGVLTLSAGTASWNYDNGDGTATGYEADGVHPLEAKKYLASLPVGGTAAVTCSFAQPDAITVRCWSTEYWGNYDAEAEAIPVTDGSFPLKDTPCIYEIFAQWTTTQGCRGNGYYAFYTE